jgi:hypothetical protein
MNEKVVIKSSKSLVKSNARSVVVFLILAAVGLGVSLLTILEYSGKMKEYKIAIIKVEEKEKTDEAEYKDNLKKLASLKAEMQPMEYAREKIFDMFTKNKLKAEAADSSIKEIDKKLWNIEERVKKISEDIRSYEFHIDWRPMDPIKPNLFKNPSLYFSMVFFFFMLLCVYASNESHKKELAKADDRLEVNIKTGEVSFYYYYEGEKKECHEIHDYAEGVFVNDSNELAVKFVTETENGNKKNESSWELTYCENPKEAALALKPFMRKRNKAIELNG